MRTQVVLAGGAGLVVGAAMNYLLSDLKSAYFRAYLPPWVICSYVILALGAGLLLVGLIVKPSSALRLDASRAANALTYIAVVNGIAAIAFAAPVLIPSFRFPILITQWPGIYMVIAYVAFLVVGILGNLAWSSVFRSLPSMGKGTTVYRSLFLLQLVGGEVGIFGMAIAMFLGGYVGAYQNYIGFGPVVVGIDMEFSVIPSAIGIFLVLSSNAAGFLNFLVSKDERNVLSGMRQAPAQ